MTKRPTFSSRFAAVLTLIGVAVGLGNVWRFPYMMGKFGGSAFLFVYLGFTILISIPALMAETALGRATQKGPLGAFSAALGRKAGKAIGYLLLLTILVAASYYIVVIANVAYAMWFSGVWGFRADNFAMYEAQLGNGPLQYGIALSLLAGSLAVLYLGLNKGIEWVSKVFVPFFLVAIVYLIANAFLLEGAPQQFLAFLKPEFGAMTAANVFAALGQAIYSLSLGGTFMLIYGSYLSPKEKLPRLALLTGAGDVGAALLASLFIVPTILVFGLEMDAGPKLIFSTLPHLFGQMPGGQLAGTLFLVALAMVAFLSYVAALEVLAGGLEDVPGVTWSRTKIIIAIGIAQAILILPSCLDPNLIGYLDLIFGSGMQVLGCGLAVIALTWGLGKMAALQQLFGEREKPWHPYFYFWLKWVIPGILLAVLIGYIYGLV